MNKHFHRPSELNSTGDFARLIHSTRICTLCKNSLPLDPKPIFQASPNARLLIVGQAPGLHAHRANRPFYDRSGSRLREWLAIRETVFYDPTIVALLPMAFCYPGSGERGDLAPPKICALTWRDRYLTQLKEICLTVLCGKYAIDWHLPHLRNRNLAQLMRDQNIADDTIVIPHPSPRNNGWLKNHPWFERDRLPHIQARIRAIVANAQSCNTTR